MRATFKTIEFDFEFEAPNGKGQYEPIKAITVCEPGFASRDVFRRMGGWVAEMSKGLMSLAGNKSKDEIEDDVAAKAPSAEPEPLVLMRLGLSTDAYEQFMRFVEKVLTNNKALAYLGTDPDNRIPITEEAWFNLTNAGGLEEMDRVIEAFTGFFLGTRQAPGDSQTTNGTAKPSGSRAPVAAASRATKH